MRKKKGKQKGLESLFIAISPLRHGGTGLKIPLEGNGDGVADGIQVAFFDKHFGFFIHIEQAVEVIIFRMFPGEMQLIPCEVERRFPG